MKKSVELVEYLGLTNSFVFFAIISVIKLLYFCTTHAKNKSFEKL